MHYSAPLSLSLHVYVTEKSLHTFLAITVSFLNTQVDQILPYIKIYKQSFELQLANRVHILWGKSSQRKTEYLLFFHPFSGNMCVCVCGCGGHLAKQCISYHV